MEYRMLGRSGCVVSSFALGSMTFGRESDEATCFAQLDRFVESGGNLIDTADVYAAGASEQVIGRWFSSRPKETRRNVVLATKGRFSTGGAHNDLGLSRKHLASALEDSLRRLCVETIDLYQVHAYDPLTPIEETLRFLDDAVRAGKIHYLGLSNFAAWQLQKAIDVADLKNLTRPISLQPQYNLLVREIEWEIVPACQAEGLGLLPWSPLGGGWLTGKYRRDKRPTGQTRLGENPNRGVEAYEGRNRRERTWDVLDALRTIAETRGITMAQVALSWVVDRPAVSSVILGARTLEQLESNLGAADVHLSQEETDELDRASDPGAADYPYGRPGIEQRTREIAGS